ncbi:hypothetical protein [Candidatus Halobonum tyrrellensis]|uniref:hypothetical protein n=1 Tax=Candidatus Halobonum tyrrellensis TaxID=1431545 RepID=UPI0012679A95|nr:hypothetical protein [Candidatus Halobonum tyrrellensis]
MCNITSKEEELAIAITIISLLSGFAIVLYGSGQTINALSNGNPSIADNYTSLLSAGATLLLVGLTGWYVYETRKLRIEEQQRQQEEHEQQVNNIRATFKAEISGVENLDNISNKFTADEIARMRRIVPTAMYENNCDQLGMLNECEVEAIVDYYGTAQNIEDLSYSYRTHSDDEEEKNQNREEIMKKVCELSCYQAHALDKLNNENHSN